MNRMPQNSPPKGEVPAQPNTQESQVGDRVERATRRSQMIEKLGKELEDELIGGKYGHENGGEPNLDQRLDQEWARKNVEQMAQQLQRLLFIAPRGALPYSDSLEMLMRVVSVGLEGTEDKDGYLEGKLEVGRKLLLEELRQNKIRNSAG